MYHCNLFTSERYYLRLLLIVVQGTRFFEYLRMVKGILHLTFHATYVTQGLLENDCKWVECFEEASLFAFEKSLYALFATSLVYRGITDTIAISDKFANHFCDDLSHQLQDWPNIPEDLTNPHYDYGLYLLSKLLKKSRKTLE